MLNARWMRDAAQAAPALEAMNFEPVSFDEARAALDEPPPGVRALPRITDADWAARRRVLSDAECRPGRAALDWLRSLPVELQPIQLMRGYARIANLLCHRWDNAELALRFVNELLIDGRGGRHGFPQPVAMELRALADHLMWQLRGRRH